MILKHNKLDIKSILIGTIIIFIIGGIAIALYTSKSKSKVETPVAIGKEFLRNIYTADAKKVAEYKKLDGQIPPGVGQIGEGVPKGSITGPNEEYTKIIEVLDKNIQRLMTKGGYESIVMNQFNDFTTRICEEGNYTAQITDLTLGKNVYGKNEDKVRYRYEVKMKFISSAGKSEEADASAGAIELLKENGEWKVSMCTINQFPKLYK